jgi:hypothetical protein
MDWEQQRHTEDLEQECVQITDDHSRGNLGVLRLGRKGMHIVSTVYIETMVDGGSGVRGKMIQTLEKATAEMGRMILDQRAVRSWRDV